jgi:hypothetical protein
MDLPPPALWGTWRLDDDLAPLLGVNRDPDTLRVWLIAAESGSVTDLVVDALRADSDGPPLVRARIHACDASWCQARLLDGGLDLAAGDEVELSRGLISGYPAVMRRVGE